MWIITFRTGRKCVRITSLADALCWYFSCAKFKILTRPINSGNSIKYSLIFSAEATIEGFSVLAWICILSETDRKWNTFNGRLEKIRPVYDTWFKTQEWIGRSASIDRISHENFAANQKGCIAVQKSHYQRVDLRAECANCRSSLSSNEATRKDTTLA